MAVPWLRNKKIKVPQRPAVRSLQQPQTDRNVPQRFVALHRELHEEVGLLDMEIGPHVWTREQIIEFIDGNWDGQRDQYHHVPVPERFEPTPALSWEQLREERLHEIRWWSLDELDAATADGIRFAPGRLGELMRGLATDGIPSRPLDTGV